MGDKLKKYLKQTYLSLFVYNAIKVMFFTLIGIYLKEKAICVLPFFAAFYILINFIYYTLKNISSIKKVDNILYSNIEKELNNIICYLPKHYILTDSYIINLRRFAIIEYKDIKKISKKNRIHIIGSKIKLAKYIYIINNNGLQSGFFIGYPIYIDIRGYKDFSNIIIEKNPTIIVS